MVIAKRREVEREMQVAQISDLCRRRLLSYADSFYELAGSYDKEFSFGSIDKAESQGRKPHGANPEENLRISEMCESGAEEIAFHQQEKQAYTRQEILTERRLWENRQVIRAHLKEMAKIMTEAACDVLVYHPMDRRRKKQLVQAMEAEGIRVENPCYLPRENDRQAFVLTMSTKRGVKMPVEDVVDMISVILDKRLYPACSCPYLVESTPQSYILEEETCFTVLTGFARAVKEDEETSGDNYAVVEAEKGRLTVMLSDGTGSGEEAGRDSAKVLDLMEKMMEAGYDTDIAINMVNTALFALGEDKKHPTLDICEIDLYQGNATLKKVGGAASFLKRGLQVQQLSGGSLPLGIFQQVEPETLHCQLQDGDYLFLVSDGVVDAFGGDDYETAMLNAIAVMQDTNPGELAERLLRMALRASGGKVKDDMTIGVVGVWEV